MSTGRAPAGTVSDLRSLLYNLVTSHALTGDPSRVSPSGSAQHVAARFSGQNGRVPSEKFAVERGTATLAGERWPGVGQPIVLLHSGVTDRRSWYAVAEELQPTTGVVAYDLRGYGETSGVTYGFSHLEDLNAVLDQVATGPVWLVGSSMGGEIAIDAALTSPERVAGLVLLAPAVSGAPEPSTFDANTDRLVRMWEAAQTSGEIDEINRIEMWLWLDGPRGPEGRVSGPARDLAFEMNAIALKNEIPEESGKSGIAAWSRLEEISVPVTVACGDLDLPFMIAQSKELADWLPKSRFHMFEGMAHLPYLEQPKVVAELINAAIR
jgi:pimeloyl-ACP methyl ester carboxylesterase